MNTYLDHQNFPCDSGEEKKKLAGALQSIITNELKEDVFGMLGRFQRILADNRRRGQWEEIFEKLKIFLCAAEMQTSTAR